MKVPEDSTINLFQVIDVLRQQTRATSTETKPIMLLFYAFLAAIAIPFAISFFKIGSSTSKSMSVHSPKSDSGTVSYPIYIGEEVMKPKAHGTCEKPAMLNLRWKCSHDTADRICCFNRHYAEHSGYWESTEFLNEV